MNHVGAYTHRCATFFLEKKKTIREHDRHGRHILGGVTLKIYEHLITVRIIFSDFFFFIRASSTWGAVKTVILVIAIVDTLNSRYYGIIENIVSRMYIGCKCISKRRDVTDERDKRLQIARGRPCPSPETVVNTDARVLIQRRQKCAYIIAPD